MHLEQSSEMEKVMLQTGCSYEVGKLCFSEASFYHRLGREAPQL